VVGGHGVLVELARILCVCHYECMHAETIDREARFGLRTAVRSWKENMHHGTLVEMSLCIEMSPCSYIIIAPRHQSSVIVKHRNYIKMSLCRCSSYVRSWFVEAHSYVQVVQ
jgi:hypothetical protein